MTEAAEATGQAYLTIRYAADRATCFSISGKFVANLAGRANCILKAALTIGDDRQAILDAGFLVS